MISAEIEALSALLSSEAQSLASVPSITVGGRSDFMFVLRCLKLEEKVKSKLGKGGDSEIVSSRPCSMRLRPGLYEVLTTGR